MNSLKAENISTFYYKKNVLTNLSVEIPKGKITTLIGPNGCGKSTLLKSLARIQPIQKGTVLLSGKDLATMKTKEIAQKMAVLPQTTTIPSELTVFELAAFGRAPHQSGFGRLSTEDREAVEKALKLTNMEQFSDTIVDTLSGGQRQRAWITMALAQETDLLILDEPTTYLDLAHQLEILLLLEQLNKKQGRTILMSLHDLNHASRFSDYLLAMKAGTITMAGTAEQIITEENLKDLFDIQATMVQDPATGKPICLTYNLC